MKALRYLLCKPLPSVARDDRDGSSRYRASKMSLFQDELGWYRVIYAPIVWIGAFLMQNSKFIIQNDGMPSA